MRTSIRERNRSSSSVIRFGAANLDAMRGIAGVASEEIDFPKGVGLWVPLGVNANLAGNRSAYYLQAMAGVRRGASSKQVNSEVQSLFKRLAGEYPQFYSVTQQGVIEDLPKYYVGSAGPQMEVSLAAAFLLLMTGYVTASNLLLSRTLSRRQEIATRFSLGAARSQIFGQFVMERGCGRPVGGGCRDRNRVGADQRACERRASGHSKAAGCGNELACDEFRHPRFQCRDGWLFGGGTNCCGDGSEFGRRAARRRSPAHREPA